jgi:hypothetical protein
MAICECQNCGQVRNTQHCLFKSNMSFFFTRFNKEINGHFCIWCTTTKFFTYEVSTLCLTWFGIIGALVGPVYILHNIAEYVEALYRFFREWKPSANAFDRKHLLNLMPTDNRLTLTIAIVFATLVGAWMFRYENSGYANSVHRNRFTGAVCSVVSECW